MSVCKGVCECGCESMRGRVVCVCTVVARATFADRN